MKIKSLLLVIMACLSVSFTACSSQSKEAETQTPDSLRIMTYNIRACRGGKDMVNPQREDIYTKLSAVINEANPEVIALQEVDSVTTRNEGEYILGEIAKRTSMHDVFAGSIKFQGGKYGIGVLSKEKPLSYRRVALPGKEERRSLLIVEFEKYIFCCTHLSLTDDDCLASTDIIVNEVKNYKKPVFLAGDMNSEHQHPAQVNLRKYFKVFNDYKVFASPSHKLRHCIDFIYGFNSNYEFDVISEKVIHTNASDHCPVVVDVVVK